MAGRALDYPLHTESLTAGLMFYLMLGIFYGLFIIVRINIVAIVLWLVLGGVYVLMLTGMLFEYGMDLLLATSRGEERPPRARASLAAPRVLALVVLVAAFATIAWRLNAGGWTILSWFVWAALLLLMPAFILNNVLISPGAMLNPVNLVQAMRRMGLSYFRDLLLLAVAAAALVASFAGPFVLYLLVFPLFIYFEFLLFHLMGLSVYAQRERYFPTVDFKADRAELQAASESVADLNRELSEAYEWLRVGEHARVIDRIDSLVKRGGWSSFEQLFSYISQWHHAAPALHLCRRYLDQSEALSTPMRALELAQWCLVRDAAFTLSNDSLQILAERAAIRAQYRTALQLIENHLAQYPDAPHKADLLQLALGLAADKLKDEQGFARLQSLR